MMPSDLAELIAAGDERSLARAATLMEAGGDAGRLLLKAIVAKTGNAMIVGITGPPGAGKSTLVDQLISVCRNQSLTVGVLAVDPSSPYTRGALLGDRVRMQRHHNDSGVFIRSMATRGKMGGLAQATLDLSRLLDASGKNVVFIETVGVGQDEIDIAQLADVTVVALVPGMGDDVQAVKAGIMEIADVFAINKADLPGADTLVQAVEFMQSLGGRRAPTHKVIATSSEGVPELFETIRSVFAKKGKKKFLEGTPKIALEIDHLGIAVKNLTESLRFYCDVLGMNVTRQETVELERVNVAMLPAGDMVSAPRLELLEATDADSAVAKFIAKRGPGLHHVAVRVDDLSAAVDRLKENGAKLLNEPRTGAGGHTYVFVHPQSTGGILLELIQK